MYFGICQRHEPEVLDFYEKNKGIEFAYGATLIDLDDVVGVESGVRSYVLVLRGSLLAFLKTKSRFSGRATVLVYRYDGDTLRIA
jgi:hypothetical protein